MNRSYAALAFILSFYLLAQIFQQVVLHSAPLATAGNLEETLVAAQHPLNYTRHVLILLSMVLMIPGFIILSLHFYKTNALLSIVSIVFFSFFCLFEISYRSVNLFQVMMVWGKEFITIPIAERAMLLPKFQNFYDTVNAIYFPLLFSLMSGSVCLFFASLKDDQSKLISVAMALQALHKISRLSGYSPLKFLDVFTGIWYFVIVFIVFVLMIIWSVKMSRVKS